MFKLTTLFAAILFSVSAYAQKKQLEGVDAVDDPQIESDPKLPDSCWWLKKPEHLTEQNNYH